MDKQLINNGGIGIGGLTFTILLILKIANLIQLNWFIVLTSFIWAPIIAFFGIILVLFIIAVIIILISSIQYIIQNLRW